MWPPCLLFAPLVNVRYCILAGELPGELGMETHLPDCPECGGDMMGFPHPVRKEALVWACKRSSERILRNAKADI